MTLKEEFATRNFSMFSSTGVDYAICLRARTDDVLQVSMGNGET